MPASLCLVVLSLERKRDFTSPKRPPSFLLVGSLFEPCLTYSFTLLSTSSLYILSLHISRLHHVRLYTDPSAPFSLYLNWDFLCLGLFSILFHPRQPSLTSIKLYFHQPLQCWESSAIQYSSSASSSSRLGFPGQQYLVLPFWSNLQSPVRFRPTLHQAQLHSASKKRGYSVGR